MTLENEFALFLLIELYSLPIIVFQGDTYVKVGPIL